MTVDGQRDKVQVVLCPESDQYHVLPHDVAAHERLHALQNTVQRSVRQQPARRIGPRRWREQDGKCK